ncbi:MAG: hypothetical protein KIS94_13385 [Chitinophagales bacterium]|nr:hypothetical protein [Chitinophagales bacterium]
MQLTDDFYYIDQQTSLLVFTEKYHLQRGYCCKGGCRHCPYGFKKEIENQEKEDDDQPGK